MSYHRQPPEVQLCMIALACIGYAQEKLAYKRPFNWDLTGEQEAAGQKAFFEALGYKVRIK